MDPLANKPAQPNPQQPPIIPPNPNPVSPQPQAQQNNSNQPVATGRPEPVAQNIAPTPERPVEAWPPAGSPAAEELANPSPPAPVNISEHTPEIAQSIGNEVTDAVDMGQSTLAQTEPSKTSASGKMDGFVSPVAKEIKEVVGTNQSPSTNTENQMSDQQADRLFQEEPATKKRNRHAKLKKILISLAIFIVLSLIALGVYIFFFGNKAAQSYKNAYLNSGFNEALSQIQSALSEQPINSAELTSGFNKLKVAQGNSSSLGTVFLGDINPNYKKAKQANKSTLDLKEKIKAYQEKYSDYPEYIAVLSTSFDVVAKLDELAQTDLTTIAAEKLNTDLNTLLTECNSSIKLLKEVEKPGDLSQSSDDLSKALTTICTESMDSLEDGIIVLLTGKTGVLSAEDQEKAKLYLESFGNTSVNIQENYKVNVASLYSFQQDALEQAKSLLLESQAL